MEKEEVQQTETAEKIVYVEKKDGCFDGCLKVGCGSILAFVIFLYVFSFLTIPEATKSGIPWVIIIVFSVIVAFLAYLMLYITDGLGNERRQKDKPKMKFKNKVLAELLKFLKICCVCLILSVAIFWALSVFYKPIKTVDDSRKKEYVLDGTAPVFDNYTTTEETLDVEAKSHVELFHHLFFTLAPDDKYINSTMEKALYLVDETGPALYNTLKEKGFYNNIVSTSSVLSIFCDSIIFDGEKMKFTYYGRQRIERHTNILMRQLVTAGDLKRVPRTENNPHGLIITNWRILQNYNLDRKQKNL